MRKFYKIVVHRAGQDQVLRIPRVGLAADGDISRAQPLENAPLSSLTKIAAVGQGL